MVKDQGSVVLWPPSLPQKPMSPPGLLNYPHSVYFPAHVRGNSHRFLYWTGFICILPLGCLLEQQMLSLIGWMISLNSTYVQILEAPTGTWAVGGHGLGSQPCTSSQVFPAVFTGQEHEKWSHRVWQIPLLWHSLDWAEKKPKALKSW